MQSKLLSSKLGLARISPPLLMLTLIICAGAVFAWVGWITWMDITDWGKDLSTIFFGSRTGEVMSLGIGMLLIHYFLIGMVFLCSGVLLFLRKRIGTLGAPQPVQVEAPKVNEKQSLKDTSAVESNGNHNNGIVNEDVFFSGCLHHFGYLSCRPKDSPIPQECILCQRLGDCMVATIYVKTVDE